jgi:hypothetical protein
MKREYFILILIAGLISLACTTRVSEWILLNASPSNYTLVYFQNGPPDESITRQNQQLSESFRGANIQFKTVDRQEAASPYFGLFYKDRLFSKFKSTNELSGLTSSPLREKIASELMAGKLSVMLYLKTDNREKDEKGLKALRSALDSSPFGGIIPVVELSRNSQEEHHFVSMLLNIEDDLMEIQEPMLFGILGRFKALEPLLGKGISEENINLMIDYFTAECSCLIKDNLPGTDILYDGKWENPRTAMVNKIIDDNPLLGQ